MARFFLEAHDLARRLQVDKFKIEAPDVGEIQKIRIGHNSEKFGAAWYLEKVKSTVVFTAERSQLIV